MNQLFAYTASKTAAINSTDEFIKNNKLGFDVISIISPMILEPGRPRH